MDQKNELMKVTYCDIGTSEIYVADSIEHLFSDQLVEICESDGQGTNSIGISLESGEHIDLNADINLDEAFEVADYEGRFLKIVFTNWYSGNVEFLEGDKVDLEKPLLVEYGLFNSIPIKGEEGEDWLEIEKDSEYDIPEITTSYFYVKNNLAIELYEEEGELFYVESGQKFSLID
jgi:hypothetical protein